MKEIARAQRFGVRPSGWVSGIAITFLSLALVGAASASSRRGHTDSGGPPILKHSTDLGLVDPASDRNHLGSSCAMKRVSTARSRHSATREPRSSPARKSMHSLRRPRRMSRT